MIKAVNSASNLQLHRSFIDSLFQDNGEIYLQHYSSLEASLIAREEKNIAVIIDEENKLLSAFEKKNEKVWQCALGGYPFLSNPNISQETISCFLENTQKTLGAEALYFPLVYKDSGVFKALSSLPKITKWDRLPCPIVTGDLSPAVIRERVIDRYGSRALRQKRKFEKNLAIQEVDKDSIEKALKQIEMNSWKRKYNQDMLSRDNTRGTGV